MIEKYNFINKTILICMTTVTLSILIFQQKMMKQNAEMQDEEKTPDFYITLIFDFSKCYFHLLKMKYEPILDAELFRQEASVSVDFNTVKKQSSELILQQINDKIQPWIAMEYWIKKFLLTFQSDQCISDEAKESIEILGKYTNAEEMLNICEFMKLSARHFVTVPEGTRKLRMKREKALNSKKSQIQILEQQQSALNQRIYPILSKKHYSLDDKNNRINDQNIRKVNQIRQSIKKARKLCRNIQQKFKQDLRSLRNQLEIEKLIARAEKITKLYEAKFEKIKRMRVENRKKTEMMKLQKREIIGKQKTEEIIKVD